MSQFLLKAVVSGLLIALINLVAQRYPGLGGWVASLPIITGLSVLWLVYDRRPGPEIGQMLFGVLWGLIPTAVWVLLTAFLLTRGQPLWLSVLAGLAGWALLTLLVLRLGLIRLG
ncbi:MAG: DUF3147 family protein [Meiothermus sp.]|nr:DUF3147 family protein [Meiothermus sp.]